MPPGDGPDDASSRAPPASRGLPPPAALRRAEHGGRGCHRERPVDLGLRPDAADRRAQGDRPRHLRPHSAECHQPRRPDRFVRDDVPGDDERPPGRGRQCPALAPPACRGAGLQLPGRAVPHARPGERLRVRPGAPHGPRPLRARGGGEGAMAPLKPILNAVSILGLLFTLIVMFALKGDLIVGRPLIVLEMAVPMGLFFAAMVCIVLFVGARLRFPYRDAVAVAFASTGRDFEIAIAIAITAFSPTVALATVVGPLVEVPVMLALVWAAMRLERRPFRPATGAPEAVGA